jgi:hypothetical protein
MLMLCETDGLDHYFSTGFFKSIDVCGGENTTFEGGFEE